MPRFMAVCNRHVSTIIEADSLAAATLRLERSKGHYWESGGDALGLPDNCTYRQLMDALHAQGWKMEPSIVLTQGWGIFERRNADD